MRNPLIRRVQRHASVSALFRQPEAAPGGGRSGSIPRAASTGEPGPLLVASAWLAPTPPPGQTEAEPSTMPVSFGLDRAQQEIPGSQPQSEVPKPGAPSQAGSPAAIPPSTIMPQAKRELVEPVPAEAESQAANEDGIWKRLQTIFRRHEEKRLSEEPTPSAGEMPVQSMQEADQPSPEPAAEAEKKPEPPRQSPVVMRKPLGKEIPPVAPAQVNLTSAGAEPAPPIMLKEQPAAGLVSEKSHEESVPAKARQAGAPAGEPEARPAQPRESALPVSAGVERGQPVPAAPVEFDVPPTSASGIQAGAGGEPPAGQALPRGKPSAAAEPPALPKPVVPIAPASPPSVLREPEEALNQVVQPMPLEAVWPVQRQVAEAPQAAPVPSPASEPAPGILDLEEHAQVREALREVVPGQPTDSAVEVITPRRPRPAFATLQEVPAAEPASESSQQVIEEHPAEANWVPTEIGALPGDLWNLIGEKPPVQPKGEGQPIRHDETPDLLRLATPERALATQRPIEQAAPPAAEPVAAAQPENGRIVQRSPEPVAGSDSTVAGAAPATGAAASTEVETAAGRASPAPPSDKELDELAARVYGEVKKRLAVEWERMRRRF